ncbi:rab effector MyRIP isoform X1 [Puntigrus tetrazona]|uniref:rab effector MyRIP isoform X1 n=1 Tax=Puntigrus tetrazona TaxID=1606681 RepID=UPI001C8916F4|nr:rab effector MyRIP isoform X1 [Puntigrus tetrazona]XP_043082505.1 rab effector MyRIP isoform X1 [Puntigrus tetrazona]
MGRKLDLSALSNDEAEHVLRVVQRDMHLRKKEEERLSEMKQELEEEGSRCLLLSKQHKFNEHCCIRCCSPFTFLLNPKRPCLDCHYNICKSCRTYSQSERGYICAACQKSRLLRTQSLEWYYNNVKSRFKRFGSAKVLKTLYRKHIIERGALSELPEVSAPEGSNDNGSVCDGSDSTLYRQSEGHSMADTLTVALRVAEEAIEEAIAKAESYRDSLEKQNEARYLHDHKEELIEELATTIVQKIIQRGKRSEIQAEYELVWPKSSELPSPTSTQNTHTTQHSHSTSQHGAVAPTDSTSSYPLWKSRSAFSLTSDDSPEKGPEVGMAPGVPDSAEIETAFQNYSSLRRESRASSLPGWKSVDRLDNSSASSVLQSPDGNWIALQSSQHSRPSLLTKRKSLVFSVLEKESGVVSAYDEMGSDSDPEDQGGWGAALLQFRRRLSDETYYTDSQHDPEWTYTQHPPITSPSSGQYTNTETLNSDSETSPAPSTRARRPAHGVTQKKKGPSEAHLYPPYRHPTNSAASPLLRPEVLDVNFNPHLGGDSSDGEERSEQVKRSRRRRKSKRETSEHCRANNALYSAATTENSAVLLNAMMMRRQQSQESPVTLNYQTPDTVTPPDLLTSNAMTPEPDYQNTVAHNSSAASPPMLSQPMASKPQLSVQGTLLKACGVNETLEEELRSKLCELVGQVRERDVKSSDFEPIREVGEKQEDRLNEKESEKPRPKERRESKREKKEGKLKESGNPSERQTVREMDTSDAVRQINIAREMKRDRERQKEIERQVERERERQRELEKQIERDRERQREIEIQVERKQERQREMEIQLKQEQERQSEIERDIEKKRKSIRMEKEKLEPIVSTECKEEEKQESSGRILVQNKSLEEDYDETEKPNKEKVKRKTPQRSHSETGPEKQEQLETKTTRSSTTSPDSAPCGLEEPMSPTEEGLSDRALQQRLQLLSSFIQQKYSAASLCSITTEVLKVLNATEELLGEAEGKSLDSSPASTPMSSGPGNRKLDQHLTKMEENVYLAAGAVYSLEGALSDLEDCARSISSSTTETELAFLEDQVATAAAQVQQSELQISDIEARISALKTAGLNVSASSRFSKYKSKPIPQTLDSSRHQRRKLPAPPIRSLSSEKEVKTEQQMRSMRL